mmetsp:Transcript_11116/g.26797  ORF Transcript_11116/g.26797 Transcript_11116/m.26797 type:complete len:380 (+) Transcript_11116:70-1209(+)|eukprot:CAMPEP_0113646980 /NCGR_PEP_ID=MMETSP0017_2-20120614/24846_1 /TAXON_ID=2856 /ORGANISM="Cylindrotheca closterium" /LENGTH=379 /DNA_ID=CAMNT_0000558965 /DNA_START=31 /DNA_END=1170 /DNA_ORIENTATION=- /assembly_acc=CAM_ASM_000147
MSSETDSMPLPKGWVRTFSNSQKRYFYSHKDTKHTQWHFPTASEAADPWMAKRRAEEAREREKQKMREKKAKRPAEGPSGGSGGGSGGSRGTDQAQKRSRPNTEADPFLALDATNVAIIVPYRDLHPEQNRAKHLEQFVPHMVRFLKNLQRKSKVSDFHVYIVEQSDDNRKFNRGKLLNIGFDMAKKAKRKHDVFIFHDVDLLPQEDLGDAYATFPKAPYHIARVWDRYSNNPKYFGGVVSFSASDFKRINGYPNTFWGWGGEDDELQLRCQNIGLSWEWPRNGGTLVDLEEMTLQDKLGFLRQHKEWKCMVKWEALEEHEKTWKVNGLNDLVYGVLATNSLDPKTNKASKITVDVKLNGDHWANDKCGVDFMGDWNKK